jgi:hypothetical protein
MKTVKFFLALSLLLSTVACNGQTKPKVAKATNATDKIEVLYFHFTARCLTCNTVEAETKKSLEALYPEQMKSGKITFTSLNVEEKSTEPIAKKHKVYGQNLIVVKGNKRFDLTNDGFLYARSNPDKFKKKIKETVDELLNQ